MTTITIDTQDGVLWLYGGSDNWKDYVCENFDENVVLIGNDDFYETKEASWYDDVRYLVSDIEDYYELDQEAIDEICNNYGEYTPDQIKDFITLYTKTRSTDDVDFIAKAAMILHPELHLDTATLRGYMQRDWQYAVYNSDVVDPTELETFYFGKLADVNVEDSNGDSFVDIITDDELWELERNGNIKEELRLRYNIPADEKIKVRITDGYTRTPKYNEYSDDEESDDEE